MVGGRPPKGEQQRHPELEELSDWFARAIEEAGYPSHNAVVREELAHKNVVYDISNAARLVPLRQVKAYALALGRDPAEVERLWLRAKEAMDLAAEVAREQKTPRLTTWTELPLPSLSLKTLLEAQARAVERLPYDMLGVEEPPLSSVYVRQRVRAARDTPSETADLRSGEPRDKPGLVAEPVGVEARLPVQDALTRHEHLLIIGDPGAGKSTLTSHLAWTLARVWLRQGTAEPLLSSEPVLPLRIAAHTLVGESASWSAMLDRAVRRSMGSSLIADPAPWLFQGRVNGARWLVLIDGLDEITDHDARRDVIRAIAQHARTPRDYRFVITSRPLPEAELSPLRGATLGEYALEPFGSEELREFATKWFNTQFEDARTAQGAVDRFLKETEDSVLYDVVRNPLLATIAAVNATVSPDRRLPTNRVSLYEAFFERLLATSTATGGGARRGALRLRLKDDPDRLELHLWLDRHKRSVLRTLGRHRLEEQGPLLDAAVSWVRVNLPDLVGQLPGWEQEIPDYLRDTGLLVIEQDGFRFLHHSFAEYFAAEGYAADIPPDFPDLESWLWRAITEDDPTLAVFVLRLWAERPECDQDPLANRLLSGTAGGHDRLLLAGILLAEGVRFGEVHTRRLVDRLLDIACCSWNRSSRDAAFEVLSSLGNIAGVGDRLEGIARSRRMPGDQRLLALEAFSRTGSAEVSEELLREQLHHMYGWLDKAAEIACGLGPAAKEAVVRRVHELMEHASVQPSVAESAIEALARLDRAEEVARLASHVLADPEVRSSAVRKATDSWLTVAPRHASAQVADTIVELLLARPDYDSLSRAAAGEVLEKYGETQAAARLAEHVLASGQLWLNPVEWAASTLVRVRGESARPALTEALERCTPDAGHYPWIPSRIWSALVKLGAAEEAIAWARSMLGGRPWALTYVDDAVITWLAAEGLPAVPAVMSHIDRGHLVVAHNRREVAEALWEAGARDEAAELAELALRTPNDSQDGYERSARLLVKARGAEAAEELLKVWKSTPMLSVNGLWLRGVTTALRECEAGWDRLLPVVVELGRCLVRLPSADGEGMMAGLRVLFRTEGAEAVPLALECATHKSWLNWGHAREIAAECVALGRRDEAIRLWRHIIEHADSPGDLSMLVIREMEVAGAGEEAQVWIRELLDSGSPSPARLARLRQLLAWAEAWEEGPSAPLSEAP